MEFEKVMAKFPKSARNPHRDLIDAMDIFQFFFATAIAGLATSPRVEQGGTALSACIGQGASTRTIASVSLPRTAFICSGGT